MCKTGVFGRQCDKCRSGYFNFTENGCQYCHCNPYGALEEGHCDSVTGKCECLPNVDGNMCEKCADGYFNITSGVGCQVISDISSLTYQTLTGRTLVIILTFLYASFTFFLRNVNVMKRDLKIANAIFELDSVSANVELLV